MTWIITIAIFIIVAFATFAVLFFIGAGKANENHDRIMREARELIEMQKQSENDPAYMKALEADAGRLGPPRKHQTKKD